MNKVRLVCGVDGEQYTCVAYDADSFRMHPAMTIEPTRSGAIGTMIQHLWGLSKSPIQIHNIRFTRDDDGRPDNRPEART